jgi:integrase
MSIFKPDNSPHWWLDIRHNGRRIRRTTGTANKANAQEVHDHLKASLWRESNLGVSSRTWNDAVKRWLSEHDHKKSIADDKDRLRWLTTHLNGKPLREITRDTVEELIAVRLDEPTFAGKKEHQSRKVANGTVNRYLAALSTILNAAVDYGWLDTAPRIRKLPEPQKRVAYLTREQFVILIAELPLHLAEMATLAATTGLRAANVLSLEWSQINMETRQAWIHPDQAKAGKAIPLPLNDEAMAVLDGRKGIHPRFVFTWRGEQIHTIGPAWFRARTRAGLENFRWHDLRHTWASWHAMGGTPINVLQELGGWASPQMVQRYAHLAPGHLAQYANKLRPFGQDLAIEHQAENAKIA